MKGLIERKHAEFWPGKSTRKLQATLYRFRSTVGEERTIKTRDLAKLFRKPPLVLMVDKVGNVNRPLDLLSQDLLHSRMVVAQRIYGDTGEQVQIALVRFIYKIGAASSVREKFVPRIS